MKKSEKIWRGVLSDVTNMDVGPGVSVYTWQMLDGSILFHAPTGTSTPVDLTLDGPRAEADEPAAEVKHAHHVSLPCLYFYYELCLEIYQYF